MTERPRDRFWIQSHERAGPVRFGMSVEQVRARFSPEPAHSFDKGAPHPIDAFDSFGVHVAYDREGFCEAVEFYPPADPVVDPLHLLALPSSELERLVIDRDPEVLLLLDGFVSFELGIAVGGTSPKGDEPAGNALAFRPGYYDGTMDALAKLARPGPARPSKESHEKAPDSDDLDQIDEGRGWRRDGFPGDEDFRVFGDSDGAGAEVRVVDFGETVHVARADSSICIPRAAMVEALRSSVERRAPGEWKLGEDDATLRHDGFDHDVQMDLLTGDLVIGLSVDDVSREPRLYISLTKALLVEFLERNGWKVEPPQ